MALKAVSPAADIHQSVCPISNTLTRSPSSTPTAAVTRHYAATNMSRQQQQRPPPVQYDFLTALGRLQDKIQALSAAKQQAGAAPTRLGASWSFLKANRGNVLLLVTFYSMSTASVFGSIMAEHRLQGDRLLEAKEQEQLQQHLHRLEQQVQQQQCLLDSLAADLQQHSSGSGGGGWWGGAAAVRQQMLTRLQRWRSGGGEPEAANVTAAAAVSDSSSSSRGSSRSGRASSRGAADQLQEPRQQASFGVRVGHLGRGFLI